MKKTLILFTVLLAGAFSLYFYSGNYQRRLVPEFESRKITTEKKNKAESSESPSGFMDAHSSLASEIKEIRPVKEAAEHPAEDPFHKKEPTIKTEGSIETAPGGEEIKEKGEKPAAINTEAPPWKIKRKEDLRSEEKEKVLPVVKKEVIITGETYGSAEKRTAAVPVAKEIIKPVDEQVIMQQEVKTAVHAEEIRQSITKAALTVEADRVAEENTEPIPAGGMIILPIEKQAPAFIELTSAGTKAIVPEREKEQTFPKMETAFAVSNTEKAEGTREIITLAGKKEGNIEKPEPFRSEMLIEGKNKRIAIFPFENLSDNRDAFRHILPLLIDKLEKRGFEVVDEDDLNNFLCKERTRHTGYISRELSGKIRKRFNVSTILTGAIISFSTEEIPEFGILARIIDTSDGTILWADYSAATGEDFIAILELGRLKTVFSLIPKVIDILFASFRTEELNREIKPMHRIAVMPFKNNTSFNNAGIIATYMFIAEILKSQQFLPIEYGDIRDIIIKLGIRRKGDIGYENVGELSKELKARGIVVGVVDNYADGAAGSVSPNVGITARLVDGSNKKILWYNSYQLSGEENIIALDWGRIRSVHSVAYKAISSLVKEMTKKKWPD